MNYNTTDWNGAGYPGEGAHTTHGYTQHEMLDALQLIHMNARLYDPFLGMFLSPDTAIQYKEYPLLHLLSHSSYSYSLIVLMFGFLLPAYTLSGNNPLSRADPTGNGFLSDLGRALTGFVSDVFHSVTNMFQQVLQGIKTSVVAFMKEVGRMLSILLVFVCFLFIC